MNKTAIKNFAICARVQLIEAAKQRAFEYEITEDGENRADIDSIGGVVLTAEVKEQRRQLISQIQHKGYMQVMEEAAYTWFNRFIALRFMEVNGYLPSKTRVFTDENGEFKPEILKQAMSVEINGLDRNKVLQLLDAQANEELYKYLIITQCNALNASLPEMFETISNWTELLFPANLLRSDSVLARMVADIPEEDWRDAVQIIGWLYQYYNTELKDDTFAKLKKNVKITKERIPAATQLFTPDWIVRYMVENSLGRIFVSDQLSADSAQCSTDSEEERIEKEKAIAENMGWKYYLPEAPQTPEVRAQLRSGQWSVASGQCLTELKLIDPCMGSGHILVYAFDVLMQIYTSAGWDQREAAQSILRNNLYGLDIDDRAAQLAYFAVMMKARQYDRRLLTRGIQPNVYSIRESNGIQTRTVEYFHKNDPKLKADIERIITEMRDAKEYGSILNIKPVDFAGLYARFDEIRRDISMMKASALEELLPLVKCAEALAQKYDVVVTNPPYMAVSNAGAKVNDYVKKNFPDSKADMFAVFIERCGQMAKKNGYQAMITQHSWMFLSSFEKLRTKLLAVNIVNMAHLGARAFEEIGGEVVQTTSFVIRKSHIADYKGEYCRLIEPTSQQGKEDMFLSGENRYAADQSNFSKIPGSPVAYWASEAVQNAFAETSLYTLSSSPSQNVTGNNDKYVRKHWELPQNEIGGADDWIFYAKGGGFRKWWGNLTDVVNWSPEARRIYQFGDGKHASQIINKEYWYKKGITWGLITSALPSFRVMPSGATYDKGGSTIIVEEQVYSFVLGLLNSCVYLTIVSMLNPTLNFQVKDVRSMPLILNEKERIDKAVGDCVNESKTDWDSYETSWDFKRNPLV